MLLLDPPLSIELQTTLPATVLFLPVATWIALVLRLVHLKAIGHPVLSITHVEPAETLRIQQSFTGRLSTVPLRLSLLRETILTRLLVGTAPLLVVASLLVVHKLKAILKTLLPPLTLQVLLTVRSPTRLTLICRSLPQKEAVALAILIPRFVHISLIEWILLPSITLHGVATLPILHPLRHSLPDPIALLPFAAMALIILFPPVSIALLRAITLLVVATLQIVFLRLSIEKTGRHNFPLFVMESNILLDPLMATAFPRVTPECIILTMATLSLLLEPLRIILKQIGLEPKIHLHGVRILIREQFPLHLNARGATRLLLVAAQKALTAAILGQAKATAIRPLPGLQTRKFVFVHGTAPFALVLPPMTPTQSLKPVPPTRQWQARLLPSTNILKLPTSLCFL